ncbi:MAG TPA: STAS domain-containing protein [Acidimicrobiales bacterium]
MLYIEAKDDGVEATIVLVGDFDLTGTEPFWVTVEEVLAPRPESVVLEARGLTFIDSSGLMALMRARDAATEAGVAFRIDEPSPALRRIVEISGLDDLLPAE